VEKFDYINDKVRAFKPDAMFGEWLSAADYDALPDYWNKATMVKRYAYIQNLGYPAPKNYPKFLRESYKALRENPNYHQTRMRLTNALLQHHDYGNAQFQIYQLMQRKAAFGAEENATFAKTLGPIDSVQTIFYRTTSEYYYLVFPLMNALNLDQMMAMDCQKHDVDWQKAWDRTAPLVKAFKAQTEKDSTSTAALAYKALNQRISSLKILMNAAEKAGMSTQFFNSPEGDEYLNIVNFYGAERLFGVAGFPEKELTDMLHYWQLRNEGMVQNLVSRSRAANVRRVVVAVGANHRAIMEKLLRSTPGVTVYTLNEYRP
ncbi:MAG: hypothetical protein H7Z72_23900, partial [Bacteroidetes bacterium]|nr:hypothetical protein [Fibrella sp.]